MALQVHPFRRIFSRFFPKKYTSPLPEEEQWEALPESQKKELALRVLSDGERALLGGNLHAVSLFEIASRLDPDNPEIWYRQGLSFFEYGSQEGKEKTLLLACKHFKIATQLNPHFFDAWVAWGNALVQLGRFYSEHRFHLEAKEKYQKAMECATLAPPGALAELYWDYGIAWVESGEHSGEALDFRSAIEAFQTSLGHQTHPSAEFLYDFANAYLELGLLVNDSRLHLQAADLLGQSIALSPYDFEGWTTLAEVYSQLYLNTMDERYIGKANESYAQATQLSPCDAEIWLNWAQILGESGRFNGDAKRLLLSVEKCARAAALDPQNSSVTAQWVESLSFLGLASGRLDLLIEAEQKILKTIDTFPDDPDLWHAYGICCIAFGRYYEDPDYYEIAIEKLQIGLSMDRTSAEHWHTLGLVHKFYAELTDHQDLLTRANRFFARAMDLKPSYPVLLFDAACTWLHYSEVADDFSALEKAMRSFETLLQNCKEAILHHPEWLYEYASALEWLGHFTGESIHFSRAIEVLFHILLIDPDFPRVHARIAQCYVELAHLVEEPEFYKRAIHFFRLSARQDEENDQAWLDWGICLIYLAHHTLDTTLMNQLYWDAEQKITRAGRLGNSTAYYNLACLYSILGRTSEAMELIRKALAARALPPIDEMLNDGWLDNLSATEPFTQFLSALETRLQAREE